MKAIAFQLWKNSHFLLYIIESSVDLFCRHNTRYRGLAQKEDPIGKPFKGSDGEIFAYYFVSI